MLMMAIRRVMRAAEDDCQLLMMFTKRESSLKTLALMHMMRSHLYP